MKLKLLITLENGNVASQDVISDWSIESIGAEFFIKLHLYMNEYVTKYNSKNTVYIQSLQAFDENEILLSELKRNE